MKTTIITAALIAIVGTAFLGDESFAKHKENKLVKAECGACHMAFQARFLSAGSWLAIMKGLNDHFGEDATVDEKDVQEITDYLMKNARRKRRSEKKGEPPLRITKLRWFVNEHRGEVSRRAKRRAGSMANCVACHRGAEKGYYDDD